MKQIFNNDPETVGGCVMYDYYLNFNSNTLPPPEKEAQIVEKFTHPVLQHYEHYKHINCDFCGQLFNRKISKIKATNYCSWNCSNNGQIIKRREKCKNQ